MRSSCLLVLLLVTLALCVQGDRNLKEQDDSTEERVSMAEVVSKFSSKGNSAVANVLRKNPSLGKMLGKNPSIAKNVEALAKDEKLVKGLKNTKSFKALREAVKNNPQAVDAAKAERFGSIMVSRLRRIQWVGDVKGMAIAYGILFLALIGIGGAGAYIYNNVRNSYIH
ncbi:hypothetical protein PR003_g21696 [Phytophthora rubi]|uniref:RxLR effector protein n=1 Tax=Phytophthora rubi TaxID=129364 RepID=A0A6A4DB58_9STRA|nr:hypothetical protein PR001_g27188 [Phytophthora rubi]KAE8991184.1 hypothetical protein PR002_g20931 [Phytophthora rubi]KAE9304693.1 hypothetical protein PR003_g21696 [Phytophthora rubi]